MYAGVNPSWLVYQEKVYTVTGAEPSDGSGNKIIQVVASFQSLVFRNGSALSPEQFTRDAATGYLLVKPSTGLVAGDKILLANLSEMRFDHTYTRAQMDAMVASKMDTATFNSYMGNYYTKAQVDSRTSQAAFVWARYY